MSSTDDTSPKEDVRTATLDEIERMHRRGELHDDKDAPAGEPLGAWFWQNAELVTPKARSNVSLRVDDEVLAYFKGDNPKGYTARMAAVLKAYVEAKRAR